MVDVGEKIQMLQNNSQDFNEHTAVWPYPFESWGDFLRWDMLVSKFCNWNNGWFESRFLLSSFFLGSSWIFWNDAWSWWNKILQGSSCSSPQQIVCYSLFVKFPGHFCLVDLWNTWILFLLVVIDLFLQVITICGCTVSISLFVSKHRSQTNIAQMLNVNIYLPFTPWNFIMDTKN